MNKRLQARSKWTMLIALLVAVSAHAAHKLAAVEAFSIEEQVAVSSRATYASAATIAGNVISGLVGGAIAAKDQTPEVALNALIVREKIDVGRIVLDEIRTTFAASSAASKLKPDASVRIKLAVKEYGIGKASGSFKGLHPYMVTSIEAQDANGKAIWKKTAYMSGAIYKAGTVREAEEWFTHPEYVREGLTVVAREEAKELLKGL